MDQLITEIYIYIYHHHSDLTLVRLLLVAFYLDLDPFLYYGFLACSY